MFLDPCWVAAGTRRLIQPSECFRIQACLCVLVKDDSERFADTKNTLPRVEGIRQMSKIGGGGKDGTNTTVYDSYPSHDPTRDSFRNLGYLKVLTVAEACSSATERYLGGRWDDRPLALSVEEIASWRCRLLAFMLPVLPRHLAFHDPSSSAILSIPGFIIVASPCSYPK